MLEAIIMAVARTIHKPNFYWQTFSESNIFSPNSQSLLHILRPIPMHISCMNFASFPLFW